MRKKFSYMLYLTGVVMLTACSADENVSRQDGLYQESWSAEMYAVKEEGKELTPITDEGEVTTRAILFGGNDGNRYYSLWDQGDNADVYYNGVKVGSFTPNDYGHRDSKLTGTLTGTYSVGEVLDLYIPKADIDYTGQNGTIASMCGEHTFMEATSTVSQVDESNKFVDMNSALFHHKQVFLRFRFQDADGIRLHIEQLTIHADGGKLLLSKPKDGDPLYGDLVVNTVKENGEYPSEIYVALHNDLGTTDTYSFTVKAGGYVYASTDAASKVTANIRDGNYHWIYRTLSLQGSASRIQSSSEVSNFENGNGDTGESGSVTF